MFTTSAYIIDWLIEPIQYEVELAKGKIKTVEARQMQSQVGQYWISPHLCFLNRFGHKCPPPPPSLSPLLITALFLVFPLSWWPSQKVGWNRIVCQWKVRPTLRPSLSNRMNLGNSGLLIPKIDLFRASWRGIHLHIMLKSAFHGILLHLSESIKR